MAGKRRRRSAIVPAVVFSASLVVAGLAVVPRLAGCSGDTTGMDFGLGVANFGFDMARRDMPVLTVANLGFDMARRD